jgi:hypothetical protein
MGQLNPKKLIFGAVITILAIIGLSMIGSMFEEVDAGEIVVIQHLSGKLSVYDQPTSFAWQGFGKVTHYKRSNQFTFLLPKDKDSKDESIEVKWNDGGHANISGSVRYDLPTNHESMIAIHKAFRSQEGIEDHLISTNVAKAIFMTGPLMTSKESYAERRNDLIFYIEDQAKFGVYKTKQVETEQIDPLDGTKKMVMRVEIQKDDKGNTARQESSPIGDEKIRLYNLTINKIKYDGIVEKQIATQQESIMKVQTAIAAGVAATQQALTTAKEGEAEAAKAKWEQEVIKARTVTEAESRKAVATLDVQTAELKKKKDILEGEGEGAKKRASMQANGALEQKLDAYVKVQEMWSNAFAAYTGSLVPSYISGGSVGGTNAGTQFMELMNMKTMRDLGLDINPGGTNSKRK